MIVVCIDVFSSGLIRTTDCLHVLGGTFDFAACVLLELSLLY